eukprot:4455247-Amphidinium_carterae.3
MLSFVIPGGPYEFGELPPHVALPEHLDVIRGTPLTECRLSRELGTSVHLVNFRQRKVKPLCLRSLDQAQLVHLVAGKESGVTYYAATTLCASASAMG